ncbi:MAG TPA: DUF1801 domain-containing protein [Candidatus Cybelea sp.]|jgi:uncharacterized protein YdhG (YjbR/CyaY superfamily)|nr:DUF1801 domain-containing protein [Candidatus Cybelea sp.]
MQKRVPRDFNDYLSAFPKNVQMLLGKMRLAIKKAAPKAQETISYNVPAFAMNGKKIVWFAAFKSHIGFYPGAAAIAAFKKELAGYKTAKGSVQFPFDEPLPLSLVARIVEFRLSQSR